MIVPFTVPEGAAVGENLLKVWSLIFDLKSLISHHFQSLPWAGGCRAELREDGSLWLTDDRLSEYCKWDTVVSIDLHTVIPSDLWCVLPDVQY